MRPSMHIHPRVFFFLFFFQIDNYKYFYHQFDVGVEEPTFTFRGDLNSAKSTKSCTAPSLVTPSEGVYSMGIDFSDAFLSFPVPLNAPKTLTGRSTAVMAIVSMLLLSVFMMRIYLHSSYSADAVGSTMTRIKLQSAAQERARSPLLDVSGHGAGGRDAGASAEEGSGPGRRAEEGSVSGRRAEYIEI